MCVLAPKVPLYARETHTSSKKKVEGGVGRDGWESPLLPALGAQGQLDAESDDDTASLNSLPRIIDSVNRARYVKFYQVCDFCPNNISGDIHELYFS